MNAKGYANRFSDPRYRDPGYYNRKKHERDTDQKVLDSLRADFGITDISLDDVLYMLNEKIVETTIARVNEITFMDRLKSFFRRGKRDA